MAHNGSTSGLSRQTRQHHIVLHEIFPQAFVLGVLPLKLLQTIGVRQVKACCGLLLS